MESGIIKFIIVLTVALFISACSSDVSEQIKGVKWEQGEYSLIRFNNNELQICKKRRGKWRSMGNYEINGNELVLKQGSNVTRGTIDVTGDGINRILILKNKDSEQHLKIDNSDYCAEAKEKIAVNDSLPEKSTQDEASLVNIQGIKWERIGFDKQFLRFKGGEIQKCYAKEGAWKTESPYQREGNSLIFSDGNRVLLSVAKESDERMILSFDNNAAYQTTQSKSCPMG